MSTNFGKIVVNGTDFSVPSIIGGAGGGSAAETTYDNTTSGLSSDNVQDAIDEIKGDLDNSPAPMVYKGTLGVSGTIQTLPLPSTLNEGFVYKVITEGSYIIRDTLRYDLRGNFNGWRWIEKYADRSATTLLHSTDSVFYNNTFNYDEIYYDGNDKYYTTKEGFIDTNNNPVQVNQKVSYNATWYYDASVNAKVGDMFISNGVEWIHIPSGNDTVIADEVAYDNVESGLEATDVQGAIDEVNGKIKYYEATGSNSFVTNAQGRVTFAEDHVFSKSYIPPFFGWNSSTGFVLGMHEKISEGSQITFIYASSGTPVGGNNTYSISKIPYFQ